MRLTVDDVTVWLAAYLGRDPSGVACVGAGSWSTGFAFDVGDEGFIVRFGDYVDDFDKDRLAVTYGCDGLPIPHVHSIGAFGDAHFAISTRVVGTPLELCDPSDWVQVVSSLADSLEVMRTCELVGTGWGGWDVTGAADHATWRDFLSAADSDEPGQRLYGWSAKLKRSPGGDASFRRYQTRLNEILADATFAVPRSLVHGDLINRNVHVADGKVTGLFDWGCSMYGDALYELAWFQFWAPWHPNMNVTLLEAELERRWDAASAVMSDRQRRLTACCLYIGLDHLAYNAHLEDWSEVAAVEQRLDALVS